LPRDPRDALQSVEMLADATVGVSLRSIFCLSPFSSHKNDTNKTSIDTVVVDDAAYRPAGSLRSTGSVVAINTNVRQ